MPDDKCEYYADLRVIDMSRRTEFGSTFPSENDNWIVLGHFDTVCITPLHDNSSPSSAHVNLELIREYTQKLSFHQENHNIYHQPTYILQEFSIANRYHVEQFWDTETAFMLVARVHAKIADQKHFEDAVNKALMCNLDAFQSVSAVDTDIEKTNNNLFHLIYRTLELSDIILIIKSNSVSALMHSIGRLQFLECVGDSYSYCCVSKAAIDKGGCAAPDDSIPFVLSRFAVEDAQKSRAFLENLYNNLSKEIQAKVLPSLFVTGTEDVMLITRDLSSRQLCAIMNSIFCEIASFSSAFEDMTTRLSILEKELPRSDLSELYPGVFPKEQVNEYSLEKEYHALCERFQGISNSSEFPEPDWIRPIYELLKSLRTISHDCVLHQVCYIVLSGTNALVRLSEDIADSRKPIEEIESKKALLVKAYSGISNLIEHMIRMEGELVHRPETRPLLLDIPANLLELYLGFSNMCLSYFQDREQNIIDEKKYALLVVPCLCSHIQVENTTYDSNQTHELLYVEIPLPLLYEPKYVICSLVHEMAHFGGEKTRMRAERFTCLSMCVAILVANALRIDNDEETIFRIQKRLRMTIQGDQRKYMSHLKPALKNQVTAICKNRDLLRDIVELSNSSSSDVERKVVANGNRSLVEIEIDDYYKIQQSIDELCYLFKECYADLAMLQLLNHSVKEYVAHLQRETQGIDPNTVERASLVIYTMNKNELNNQIEILKSTNDQLSKNIAQYLSQFTRMSDSNSFGDKYHSREITRILAFYLSLCYEEMCDMDKNSKCEEDSYNIRDYFELFAEQQRFASVRLYDVLRKHRDNIKKSYLA